MEIYNLKGLKENLEQFLSEQGLSQHFKDNPAFQEILDKLRRTISAIRCDENVYLSKKSGEGFINLEDQMSGNNSRKLVDLRVLDNGKAISLFIRDTEETEKGNDVLNSQYERLASEYKISLNDNGHIDVNRYSSRTHNVKPLTGNDMLDQKTDLYWSYNSHNNTKYDENGIVTHLEEKRCIGNKALTFPIGVLTPDAMHRGTMELAFGEVNRNPQMADQVYFYQRENIDVMFAVVVDNTNGYQFRGYIPISRENLAGMSVNSGDLQPKPADSDNTIIIPKLSQEEIEKLIALEPNSKKAEGLRKYAAARELFSYNSSDDPDFIDGFVQDQSSNFSM